MTLEPTDISEEQLMNVRDRSLEEAYAVHDVGQDLLVARLEAHGFEVLFHGDDARHADEVFFGDGPDIAAIDPSSEDDDPDAYLEVKTKEDEEWFGRCNRRHYKEYVNFANEVDVPVFIWFALVDSESDAVLREAFVEVEDTDQLDGPVTDITDTEVVFYEDDIQEVNDEGLLAVDGSDLVGVDNDEVLVDGIPDVWGNKVVELNDDAFRSFPYFLDAVGK